MFVRRALRVIAIMTGRTSGALVSDKVGELWREGSNDGANSA